jgi:hypothetical protein
MVGERVAPTRPEPAGGLLNRAPGKAINDPRIGGVFLVEKLPKLLPGKARGFRVRDLAEARAWLAEGGA